MKLTTLNSKLKLCSVGTNSKTVKGDSDSILTMIMYLSPHTLADRGNVCANATDGCRAICLYSAGRGKFNTVQQARIRRTQLFFDNNVQFKSDLLYDLELFNTYCIDNNLKPYVRLNGTSDIDWQKIKLKDNKTAMELFNTIQFYDYTKDMKRRSKYSNYDITYSYNENMPVTQINKTLNKNNNLAVVFLKTLPSTWNGHEVINGDESDLRPLDKKGVIVGLIAKGLAKTIKTDFVVDPAKLLLTNV